MKNIEQTQKNKKENKEKTKKKTNPQINYKEKESFIYIYIYTPFTTVHLTYPSKTKRSTRNMGDWFG